MTSPFYTGEPAGGPVGFTAVKRAPEPDRASMNAPRQLALALPHAESFAREDFLTGAPNAAALAMIERWPDWPDRALALVGPEGAGKSHLAAIWAEIAGARRVSARALGETNLMARARDRRAGDRGRAGAAAALTSARCSTCST